MDRFSLVNINDHPTNRNKKVFYFKVEAHANYFEGLLNEQKVPFEKQIDHEGDGTYYFGIKNAHYQKVIKLNYLTIGHFRKPFIPDIAFRYILIAISMLVLGLAIAGALLAD